MKLIRPVVSSGIKNNLNQNQISYQCEHCRIVFRELDLEFECHHKITGKYKVQPSPTECPSCGREVDVRNKTILPPIIKRNVRRDKQLNVLSMIDAEAALKEVECDLIEMGNTAVVESEDAYARHRADIGRLNYGLKIRASTFDTVFDMQTLTESK